MVAPLLRGKGPRRSYCRGGRLAQQFGRFVTLELKTGEHRQRPTAGSAQVRCADVLTSTRWFFRWTIAVEERSEHRRRQLRSDWRLFNALVDVMERRVLLFSCNLACPNCCYCCGSTEDLVDEEELRGWYQRVNQVCGGLQRTRTSCTDPWACLRCCSGRQAQEEVITRSAREDLRIVCSFLHLC